MLIACRRDLVRKACNVTWQWEKMWLTLLPAYLICSFDQRDTCASYLRNLSHVMYVGYSGTYHHQQKRCSIYVADRPVRMVATSDLDYVHLDSVKKATFVQWLKYG